MRKRGRGERKENQDVAGWATTREGKSPIASRRRGSWQRRGGKKGGVTAKIVVGKRGKGG